MGRYVLNDIRLINPSIIFALFGLFISLCIIQIGIDSVKSILLLLSPLFLCSIPYISTFFIYKKIKLYNNSLIISNAFFKLKTFNISEIKNINILIINDLPVYVHSNNFSRIKIHGEINTQNIAKLLIYDKMENLVYNHNIQYLKYKFLEKTINDKLGYNTNGIIYLKPHTGSLETEKTEIFNSIEEANNLWMKVS
ncbi:MAG: hypothetical protein FWD28_01485 [Treponema sp.]|nr:hypothetical protein [Treponema sp.]